MHIDKQSLLSCSQDALNHFLIWFLSSTDLHSELSATCYLLEPQHTAKYCCILINCFEIIYSKSVNLYATRLCCKVGSPCAAVCCDESQQVASRQFAGVESVAVSLHGVTNGWWHLRKLKSFTIFIVKDEVTLASHIAPDSSWHDIIHLWSRIEERSPGVALVWTLTGAG